MFKCNECGRTFEEPAIIKQSVPYGSTGAYFPLSCCPYCNGTFEETEKICELCGDYYSDSKHDDVCESCINIIANRFEEVFHQNFTPFERSIINSVYEGRNLE